MHGEWLVVWGQMKANLQFRQYVKRQHPKDESAILQYVARNVEPYLLSLHHLETYDLLISVLHPHNYVLSKAKRKAGWIHTDYSTIEVNTE
jgi:hypothetical protein